MQKIFIGISVIFLLALSYLIYPKIIKSPNQNFFKPSIVPPGNMSTFGDPISGGESRITKKPFGIYVTPNNSPIQPEKFTGYHTGTDFETYADEADKEISIYAICDGPLLQKRTATGYGGVAVQSCQLDGNPVTIVYGHIKITSVTTPVGQKLKRGQQLATLGKGYSIETDGERKHLHLGIHRGSGINIKGYVQTESELNSWINFQTITK